MCAALAMRLQDHRCAKVLTLAQVDTVEELHHAPANRAGTSANTPSSSPPSANKGTTSWLNAASITSSGKTWPTASTNWQPYSCAYHRGPSSIISSAKKSGVKREHSSAVTLIFSQRWLSVQTR